MDTPETGRGQAILDHDLAGIAQDRLASVVHDDIKASEARVRNGRSLNEREARDDARTVGVRGESEAAAADRAARVSSLKALRLAQDAATETSGRRSKGRPG